MVTQRVFRDTFISKEYYLNGVYFAHFLLLECGRANFKINENNYPKDLA